MRLEVDGRPVEVAAGATLLEATRADGAAVPTLCFDERLSPAGACRVCLVDAGDGRGPVPACTTPAADGMRVSTGDPSAVAAARGVLELLVSSMPDRALELPPERSELVQVCEMLGVERRRLDGGPPARGRDDSHPYVKLDRDLCIACGRCVRMCDEVQGTFALELVGRGFPTVVAPGSGGPWAVSDCVACGGCVDTCPTGALSEPGLLDPRPVERTVATTCGYCGVGCGLDVHVRGDAVAAVTATRDAPVNRGHACVKGRFAHGFVRSPERLTRPLVRRDGELREATWDEALSFAEGELRRIRDNHGPRAIAAISSARATNEESYLVQKLMRTVIGVNSVDNCSRLCHAPSAAGLSASLGLAGGTNPSDDLDRADCFLLAGSNATEAHPVVGARIKQQVLRGARLVVVDPRRIELAGYADVHLRNRPGTNVAVFNGLAHVLVAEGLTDERFLAERAGGVEQLRRLLGEYTPERVEEISGVPAELLRRGARIYGEAARPSIVYGLGITEHAHGTDGVRTLANLAILTGNVGRADRCGINPLRGQNNVQGASDVGALPEFLPGYQPLSDEEAVKRFERAWGVELDRANGLRIPAMFDAALAGDLKALWIVGEDIAQTDPDSNRVERVMEACELVICQEIFLSRTAERADVVLPAASFLEKDGTFVNFDRRFQRVRPALPPPGDAKTDFEIVQLLARHIRSDLGCATPADAMDEMAALTPAFAGISHARLDREGALHWPCRSAEDPGEAVLHLERFATADGRAQLAAAPYLPPGEETDADHPFLLVTGRRLEHYNAGTMTRRTANLELVPVEWLEIHPDDAARVGVAAGGRVRVESRRGRVELEARPTERVAPGQLFMAFHFPEALANALTSDATDAVTDCPEYKVTAVSVPHAAMDTVTSTDHRDGAVPAAAPPPSLDALLPPAMAEKAELVGVKKASLGTLDMLLLAVLAGAFIGLGAMFATTVGAGAAGELPYGVARLLAGVVFSLGLILVVVAGAELFTGNNLIVMATASGRVPVLRLLRNWGLVYVGNLVGAVATAALVFAGKQHEFGEGAVGANALAIAQTKGSLGFVQAIALGMLCNALVCMAIWLTYSARSVTDKVLAIVFPITAFVAAGFEHSVANMYFLPTGLLVKTTVDDPGRYPDVAWTDALLGNLLPVTVGNAVGGAVMVGMIYWVVYLRRR